MPNGSYAYKDEVTAHNVTHVDVRGTRIGGVGSGGERTITFAFYRRYNIATQNWALNFLRGDPAEIGGEWIFAPGDTGGNINTQMAAWNQIEQGRAGGRPAPLWWGPPNDNITESKWHKNLGAPLRLETQAAGHELAQDIIGTQSSVNASLQTTRPNSAWEEIKTEFFMEAMLGELGRTDLQDGQGNPLSQERTGDFNRFLAMINTKGIDFGRYSEYEDAEMTAFQEIMEEAWNHAGGNNLGDWSGVAGREQTSDETGKFFLHGLEGRIADDVGGTPGGVEEGSAEAADIIRTAFAEEAIRNLDDVNAYLQSNYQGDLVQAIYNITPEDKYNGIESLSYFAKQTADRAIVMSIWENISQLGTGAYDYYMPIPRVSTLGFDASSWMGVVRITPDVTMEPAIDQHGNQYSTYPVLTRIDAQADAIYVGKGGPGKTGGMPINAMLNYLQMTGQLDATQLARINARVIERTNSHVAAQTSAALVGGMYSADLADETAKQYLGSTVDMSVVELASTQDIADNIGNQFEQFGQGLTQNLASWYEDQVVRANELSRTWRSLGKSWWRARANFRTAAINSGVNVPTSQESSMFRDDSGGGDGTIGNVMNNMGQGRLIGTPFFLSTGPFNPAQWETKSASQRLIRPLPIAGGGTAVDRASDPAWRTAAGRSRMGWAGVEDAPIRFGDQSWDQYTGGSDAAADARLSARQSRLGVGPGI